MSEVDRPDRWTAPLQPREQEPARPGLFLKRFLDSLAHPLPDAVRRARRVIALCHALLSERGEVSGARLATDVLMAYQSLDGPALDAFFVLLVDEFSPNPSEVAVAADAFRAELSQANLIRLQAAVESPRQELFRRFNMAPGGTGLLVDLRRQLLKRLGEHPEWAGIDADLAPLFRSWFNRGFLVMQRIDWRTSALVLERLIQYEAVHQIQGWRDLRRRLEVDRRCYAFFSPALPDEPLIFIEVALTRGLPARVQPLLDPEAPVVDPTEATYAIFYSITNCQEGLRGVSLGNFLIKQVVEDLGRGFHRLKTFATLSPIPGFGRWLTTGSDFPERKLVSPDLAVVIDRLDRSDPLVDAHINPALEAELTRLCAYYLLHAKRGNAPLDPVARFHLANGANLQRLNWMGDTSATGLRGSLGLTVNYVYRLADVERNHEAYAKDYRVVASRELERLAKQVIDGTGDAQN